jgi:hypothetical protein
MKTKHCLQSFASKIYRKEALGMLKCVKRDNIKIDRKEMVQEVGISGGHL